MAETWFCSDHHFQHARLLTFTGEDGLFLRPEFTDIDEHDNYIVERHNDVVSATDDVWVMGDVTWKTNKRAKELIGSLNGRKHFLPGNHDDIDFLRPLFVDIHLWMTFKEQGFRASHVPIWSNDLRGLGNVHGHTHEKDVMLAPGVQDMRYVNVSMESIGYEPIHMDMVSFLLSWKDQEVPNRTQYYTYGDIDKLVLGT